MTDTSNKFLTIFTPTYNRARTLARTYESLCNQTCKEFEWLIIDDGSGDKTNEIVYNWISENKISIKYIYKSNGGLHTGYNVAIENIYTELCVCIDSDDYMPNNAVEIIKKTWNKVKNPKLAGIIGLDFYSDSKTPVGGYFKDISKPIHFTQISTLLKHHGDTKMVVRTNLLKPHIPMKSFEGEKNFNPIYLFYKIDPSLSYILINENLCFVDYQDEGMSASIFNQYINSPRSFAEIRYEEIKHPLIPLKRKIISASHLVSSALIANDFNIILRSPKKILTFCSFPMGIVIYFLIKSKGVKTK